MCLVSVFLSTCAKFQLETLFLLFGRFLFSRLYFLEEIFISRVEEIVISRVYVIHFTFFFFSELHGSQFLLFKL